MKKNLLFFIAWPSCRTLEKYTRLGNSSQPTFAQKGQKNYYSVHSLCHSAVVGCYSFAPFGGVSLLHPLPPGVARGWHINAPYGA